MDHISLERYFSGIASKLKAIQHSELNKGFCMWYEEDVISSWQSKNTAFMILNEGTGMLKKEGISYYDARRMGFEIHVPIGEDQQNQKHRTEAINEAEKIGKQVIARIIEDSEDFDPTVCPRFIKKFKAETVLYESFESKIPHFMTCLFSFEIEDDNFLEIEENQWL